MSATKVTRADIILLIPILLMGVVAQFASDNYLPSFPVLSHYFQVSNSMIKWSMSTYLFGMGCSQLLYGPASDSWGRKPLLLFGFIIFITGSLICALSETIHVFLLARFIQGAGMGAGLALYRAILRDCFDRAKLAKVGAIVLTIVSITPPLAPITGGYVEHYLSWQMNFYIIAFVAAVYITFLMLRFPETSPKLKYEDSWFIAVLRNMKKAFCCTAFNSNLIVGGLTFSAIMVYLTMSPYLFQEVIHVSAVIYGWTNVITALGMFIGGVINVILLSRFTIDQMMRVGALHICFGAGLLIVTGLFGWVATLPVLFSVFFLFMGCGYLFSNATVAAIQPFPDSAGLVGALYGSFQVLITSVVSAAAALIHVHNQEIIGMVLLAIGGLMVLIKFYFK